MKLRIKTTPLIGLILITCNCSYDSPVSQSTTIQNKSKTERRAIYEKYDLHVISHNNSGDYDPSEKLEEKGIKTAKEHVRKLMSKLDQSNAERILIFCHGGLNAKDSSRDSAKIMCDEIVKNSNDKIFPICITWRSGFFTTYWSSLVHMRSGIPIRSRSKAIKKSMQFGGIFFRFPTDVLTGVARIPRNYPLAVDNALQNWDGAYNIKPMSFPVKYSYNQSLTQAIYGDSNVDPAYQYFNGVDNIKEINTGQSKAKFKTSLGRTRPNSNKRLALHNLLMTPVKATTLPLVDSIGAPAWKTMTHRTRALVRPNSNLVVATHQTANDKITNDQALKLLTRQLAQKKNKYKIELYGHSMGTMVFNELIREINQKRFDDPNFENIVYMGAACSVKDFSDTVGIYLQKHKSTEFANLCLHPACEVRETFNPYFNVAVSGSLLIWIDSYYESPRSPTDRTLGNYMNAINLWRYIPQRENITIKAFGHQQKNAGAANYKRSIEDKGQYNAGPQKHGQFTHFRFWNKEFQQVKPASAMPTYCRYRN